MIVDLDLSARAVGLPLPLAGEGWALRALASTTTGLSVPSPLVGEGQGGG